MTRRMIRITMEVRRGSGRAMFLGDDRYSEKFSFIAHRISYAIHDLIMGINSFTVTKTYSETYRMTIGRAMSDLGRMP